MSIPNASPQPQQPAAPQYQQGAPNPYMQNAPQPPVAAVPLDQPYYGCPFPETFIRFWKKYATFKGRASRSEFWWFMLADVIITFMLSAIANAVDQLSFLPALWALATFVPSIALATRRLHDTNKSGWWLFGYYALSTVVIITFFTSIFPIISFAFETFLPNPGDYSFLYTGDANNLTTKWWVTSENVTENGMYGQKGILYNNTIWTAFKGTMLVSVSCALIAGTIGTLIGYAVSKNRRSRWANYVNSVAFLPYLMPSIAVGVAFFILFSNQYFNLFNTYALLIIAGTIKYIPFASRSSLNSMLQLSGEIEEAAVIQDVPWVKRMTRIIIPIQKSSIISGYLLPFMTCLRELSLFMLLCVQGFILSTTLDYFDEMGLYAFSSGINLILIVTILICNALVNKVTGASLDKGIGG